MSLCAKLIIQGGDFVKRAVKVTLAAICIVITVIVGVFTFRGYAMYRAAKAENPPLQAIEQIRRKEDFTPISELPKMYTDAVIAVEDRRFYYHNGIDPISICRALFNDVRQMKLVEGGSTITQQLAKNMFFTQDRKLERKIAEVFMAWKLERMLTKEEILELYVNSIYFGSGYYSVKSAALGYYGKQPSELDDFECTMLAGLPNAPSVYSLDNNPQLAMQRQAQVVAKLVKYGYISEKEGANITSGAEK